MSGLLKVSSNPHVRARMKTDNIMLLVLIAFIAGLLFRRLEFRTSFSGCACSLCGIRSADGVSL